jgi:DNA-binding NtrC family response regulator
VSRSLLVVDDDATIRGTLEDLFSGAGWAVASAASGAAALTAAAAHAPDVAVLDLRLPDTDGVTLLRALLEADPDLGVLLLSGHADVPTAVRAMREGAADVLEKPVDLEALLAAADRAAAHGRLSREVRLRRQQDRPTTAPAAVGPTLDHLIALAARHPDAPVLITGETGTGKGYVARLIHDRSPRAAAPFVAINAAALSPTFVESELFGHERGAFTDARQAKRGLLEIADTGTLFLDEVGELPLEVQPRLLTVLEDRRFRRLGGTTLLRSDARLIAATNVALPEAVARQRFRADLLYRLQVLELPLPPLREQPDRLAPLSEQFLPKGARLSTAAKRAIAAYAWPGNIRELKNTLWRAAILAGDHAIAPEHLGLSTGQPDQDDDLTLEYAEKRAIIKALKAHEGNKTLAAKSLGIARSTLAEKLNRYDLT